MKRYQQTKKELSIQVFDTLADKGYLIWEEVKRTLQCGEYPTTLTTNFDTITQARELLRSIPEMEDINVDYADFFTLKNRVLFTINPRITDQNT